MGRQWDKKINAEEGIGTEEAFLKELESCASFHGVRVLFPSPSRGSYFSILSFTCLILTGFQSRIAVQNQIRLWNKLLSP